MELRVRARVTVRTNLDQLIGGATEETIIARVGQGIVTAIGAARTHMEVMALPDRISQSLLERGLDANTAFEIVSIDIASIDVGENIGARLQSDQAEADMRMAQARAEGAAPPRSPASRKCAPGWPSVAAQLVLAEAQIPAALALAFRAGWVQAPGFPVRRAAAVGKDAWFTSRSVGTRCGPAVPHHPAGLEVREAEGGARGGELAKP